MPADRSGTARTECTSSLVYFVLESLPGFRRAAHARILLPLEFPALLAGQGTLMNVLVVGGGGREHALAWAAARSSAVQEVICAPGSDGIAREARVEAVDLADSDAVIALAGQLGADLVVVGPEAPLVDGIGHF